MGTVGNQLLRVWIRGQVQDSKNFRYGNGFEVFHSFLRRLSDMLCHDPPDKARQFSCCRDLRDVSRRMGFNSKKLSLDSCVTTICVGNDLSPVSFLLFLQADTLSPDCASSVMLCGFHQESSKMLVSCFGDSQAICLIRAGMLTGDQAQICRELNRLYYSW